MRAVVQDEYGTVGVLRVEDVALPTPAPGEVLLRVRAASVNPPDWAGVHGVPYIVRVRYGLSRPTLRTLGTDVAGSVVAVGPGVTEYRVGDDVFGAGIQTFAEYAVARVDRLAPLPQGASFEQAAAVPVSGITALQALRDTGGLVAGQRVLVVGAGGGVGSFAVQIAAALGARVTGVCSASKADLVRSLGADRVIDYATTDFTRAGTRYDLVLDNVLSHPLSRLLGAVARTGTLVPNGGQFYKRVFASTGVMLIKAPLLSLVVPQRIRVCTARLNGADMVVLADMIASGKVTPVIGATYPLEGLPDAIAHFGEGHTTGKLVIKVAQS